MKRRRENHDHWVGSWSSSNRDHGTTIRITRHNPINHREREMLVKKGKKWRWVKARADYHDKAFTISFVEP